MKTVTKLFEISYAHHLPDYEGNCKNPHGHNAIIEITVSNRYGVDPETGFICDFKKLKDMVDVDIVKHLDHKDLNTLFDNPTSENVVTWIADKLNTTLENSEIVLERIRFWETSTSYTEWTKER